MSSVPLELLLGPQASIPALVVRRGAIARHSEAARDLLGGEVGSRIDELFDRDSRPKLASAIAAAPACCELQARPGGGEAVTLQIAALPLDEDERLLVISRVGPDYSVQMAARLLAVNDLLANTTRELSRQSAELAAARTRFEALADLREHFVSVLAHDLRGALGGIVLGAEVVQRAFEAGSGERLLTAVARIRSNAARITDLTEKVLVAARSETGQIVLEREPTSLTAVARDAIETYAPIADRAGIRLELIDRSEEATVAGDRVRLGQVAGNLLENAIRHSPSGETVTLELSRTQQRVRLVVRDRGAGIPEVLREGVFDRFVQGARKGGSLGLGLYVARQIVELHGGRIHVEDVAPHGAAFVVELPRDER